MEKIQREFDEWKKRSDTIAVDTDVSTLQLLIAKPACVFDHFAAMGALEDVVVSIRKHCASAYPSWQVELSRTFLWSCGIKRRRWLRWWEKLIKEGEAWAVRWLNALGSILLSSRREILDYVHFTWRNIRTCLPQGSLLGPLLFNMYVNDLNYFNTNTSLRLYADDTTEYASDVSPVVLQFVINSDLSVLSRWFRMNFFTD